MKPTAQSTNHTTKYVTVFLLLAGVAIGYLIWRKPEEPAAPQVAAKPPAAVRVETPAPMPAQLPPMEDPAAPPAFDPANFGDPAQMQQMRQQMAQQMVEYAYSDLFAQLDITPAQSEALKGVITERAGAFQDAMQNYFQQAFQGGGQPNFDPATFQQIGAQVEAQYADKIKGIVGDTNAQQIQAYDASLQQQFQNGGPGGGGFGGGQGGFGGGGQGGFGGFPGN